MKVEINSQIVAFDSIKFKLFLTVLHNVCVLSAPILPLFATLLFPRSTSLFFSQIYILYMAIITSIAIFYLCIPRYAGVGYFWSTLKKIKVILSLFSVFSSRNLITILEVQLNKYAKLFFCVALLSANVYLDDGCFSIVLTLKFNDFRLYVVLNLQHQLFVLYKTQETMVKRDKKEIRSKDTSKSKTI